MSAYKVADTFDGGDAAIFVFADHASNFIPETHRGLGLSSDLLATHIAWDVGAGDLALKLAGNLQAKALFCRFSRLLIDPNRALNKPDSIPASSDRIQIPGNTELSSKEREHRISRYYHPYHAHLDHAISQTCNAADDPLIISVHSFTPTLQTNGEERPWHVGLLWREDRRSASALMELLRRDTDYLVGDNQPYDARVFNYSIDRHVSSRGLRHLTLEVRQDLLSNEAGVDEVAGKLSAAIQKL